MNNLIFTGLFFIEKLTSIYFLAIFKSFKVPV